jgi:hypothetical protein
MAIAEQVTNEAATNAPPNRKWRVLALPRRDERVNAELAKHRFVAKAQIDPELDLQRELSNDHISTPRIGRMSGAFSHAAVLDRCGSAEHELSRVFFACCSGEKPFMQIRRWNLEKKRHYAVKTRLNTACYIVLDAPR